MRRYIPFILALVVALIAAYAIYSSGPREKWSQENARVWREDRPGGVR